MLSFNIIEDYLEKPYWVIDILPKQVPPTSDGQYFNIEKYFLKQPQRERICRQFSNLLIKLNCYFSMKVCHSMDDWTVNPIPEKYYEWLAEGDLLYVILESEDAMIGFNGDDHYMTLYNPNAKLLELICSLVVSEGLFVWKPEITINFR